jgi:hypothetical protein
MNVAGAVRFRSDRPPGNPFATRFTRPGAVPPLDRDGRPLDVAALAARLRTLGSAAIVGPHGHGKTTLLVAIADAVAAAGRPVSLVRARGWADILPTLAAIAGPPAGALVCIDGWESLGPGRWPLRQAARALGRPLLVTSHGPAGLPVLRACATSDKLLAAIVARLPDHGGRIGAEHVAAAFGRHGGNLRDSLAELYDRYERTAASRSPTCCD